MAVCWYDKEQWQKLRTVAADPEDLEDTYEEWLEGITSYLKQFGAAVGREVTKIDVNIDELQSWCNLRGLPINGEARSQYAMERSAQQSR